MAWLEQHEYTRSIGEGHNKILTTDVVWAKLLALVGGACSGSVRLRS
jgi:hypothetical protein